MSGHRVLLGAAAGVWLACAVAYATAGEALIAGMYAAFTIWAVVLCVVFRRVDSRGRGGAR